MADAAADLAEELEPSQAELADGLAAFCLERVPELPRDEEAVELLRAGARGHLAIVTGLLATPGAQPDDFDQPQAAAAYAAMCARRGIDVGVVQRATRLGVDWFWRTLGERLADTVEDRGRRGELLDAGMEVVLGYADLAIGWIEPTYMEERRRWVRSPEAIRRATTLEVLADGPLDADGASRRLGYELSGEHRALILWPVSAREERTALEGSIKAAGGGRAGLLVADGEALWAWVDGTARLNGWRPPPRWRAVAGDPGPGREGFRRSHEEARIAYHALRPLGAAAPALARYGEVAIPALLNAAEPRRARDLVHRVLGPLAADDERAARLRATVSAYHAAGCRYAGAAERLAVHENTVAYRLRQAAELLGRPLDEPRLELAVALRLLETFGHGWLAGEAGAA